jgi:hypothetical protein
VKGGGTKLETMDDPRGYDPELEKLVGKLRTRPWDDEKEINILKRYYGKVPTDALAIKIGRSSNSIRDKAASLGIKFSKSI